ncbi:MAG: hypothetical protein PHO07_19700 [Pirellulales bacterium]|nr:hypothetical protein [Thermoguttaceae bacterium]MDD4789400.1 hypothetical protein [Pirellulales bacterium]NLY98921.1 hypothetical protein [Pirellulaceae bacterium]
MSHRAKWSEYFANAISEEREKGVDERQKRDDRGEVLREHKDETLKDAEDGFRKLVCPMMQAFAGHFGDCVGPRNSRKDDVLACRMEIPRPGEYRSSFGVEVTLAVDKDCHSSSPSYGMATPANKISDERTQEEAYCISCSTA